MRKLAILVLGVLFAITAAGLAQAQSPGSAAWLQKLDGAKYEFHGPNYTWRMEIHGHWVTWYADERQAWIGSIDGLNFTIIIPNVDGSQWKEPFRISEDGSRITHVGSSNYPFHGIIFHRVK